MFGNGREWDWKRHSLSSPPLNFAQLHVRNTHIYSLRRDSTKDNTTSNHANTVVAWMHVRLPVVLHLFCDLWWKVRLTVVLTETWHICSGFVASKMLVHLVTYVWMHSVRIPLDTTFQSLAIHNHSGLVFICLSGTKITQRQLGISPTTCDYLCTFVKTSQKNFLLLGVYRRGSKSVTWTFSDECTTVLEEVCLYSVLLSWVETLTFT